MCDSTIVKDFEHRITLLESFCESFIQQITQRASSPTPISIPGEAESQLKLANMRIAQLEKMLKPSTGLEIPFNVEIPLTQENT